ncbi:neuropeptide FF receptor 2-like isoform X2 [Actinia tenebrosa]|uniref:Neuropeptide FF receptor 2-like isoform X2 n=1 Tax=Actinia tenebrosa TaxID=6105 RepID=A0A6P8HQ54_ACTTE|nr:neuropeptide FF receptor 2-like isoform X2 [Actinia tenebrosa]XP_031557228.1 neuropeptide FF receptor 2-like isoform X2 [Actinia tenebrosa]XP_031557229.1 neuropeptide FF receptor 2-like isoform X2 [Actinia tenebrosa]
MDGAMVNATAAPPVVLEPLGMRVIRLAIYIIIFLIATIGNSLVIFVVYKTRELHTVTGYLIANLAIADLGVGLLCIPFTVVVFELNFVWPFGYFMCKLISPIQVFFLMGSVGTLMAISIDRHQSIVYPFNPRITITQGKLIIALIWLIALFPAFPMLGVMKQSYTWHKDGQPACMEDWPDQKLNVAYTVASFLLTYAIPLPMIIILYIRIGLKLREAIKDAADRPGFHAAQQTTRIIKMLVAVVVCYALCYLPFHTLYFTVSSGHRTRYTDILNSYCQVIMYFNSASNPILYAFLGDLFRDGFRRACGMRSKKEPLSNCTLKTAAP